MKNYWKTICITLSISITVTALPAWAQDSAQLSPAAQLEAEYKRRKENRARYELPVRQFEVSPLLHNIFQRNVRTLDPAQSQDWKAIGDIIVYEPAQVIDSNAKETARSGGPSFDPHWSKLQAGVVTTGLASVHKASPKLIERFGKRLVIKKLSEKSAPQNPAFCYIKGDTLCFTEEFFKSHYVKDGDQIVATLNIFAALIADSYNTEQLSNQKVWTSSLQRLQQADAFCRSHFEDADITAIDHELSQCLFTPTMTASRYPKAALEQSIAKYCLDGIAGAPAECEPFFKAVVGNDTENLDKMPFTPRSTSIHKFAIAALTSVREQNKRSRLYQMHLAHYWLELGRANKEYSRYKSLTEALTALDDNLEETEPRSAAENLLRASLFCRLGQFAESRKTLLQMPQTSVRTALLEALPERSNSIAGIEYARVISLFNKEIKALPPLKKLVVSDQAIESIANAYGNLIKDVK